MVHEQQLGEHASMQTYTRAAMWLHWVMAVMVLALMVVGFSLPEEDGPMRTLGIQLHKSFGLTVWALFALRLAWRSFNAPPPLPAGMPRLQRQAAETVHVLLYILLFVQPLLGYLSASFAGYPMKWFGYRLPNWGWKDPALNDFFSECHEISAFVFIALIAVHTCAALYHGFVRRDGLLRRMGLPLG
jgi:cytochrome b561